LYFTAGGLTDISSEGTADVRVNSSGAATHAGTGGLSVYSGGASPTKVANINNAGVASFNGGIIQSPLILSGVGNANYALHINSGASASEQTDVFWDDQNVSQWDWQKASNENFQILDVQNSSRPRIAFGPGSFVNINSGGTAAINFNTNSNSGTGGVNFYSGGAGPTLVAAINSSGILNTYGGITTTGNGVSSVVASSGAVTIGSGANISATSLCSTTQCPSGRYDVKVYIDVTTACGTTGGYIPWLGYTDDQGAKSGSSTTTFFPANGNGVTPSSGSLALASTANWLSGDYFLNSTGATAINYGATATACGSGGPAAGKMYLDVIKIE